MLKLRVSAAGLRLAAVLCVLAAAGSAAAPAEAQDRLCDPGAENCRSILIDYIRAETVGIDVAFWFMEDSRFTTELIRKWQAGVPVRVLVDQRANATNAYNAERLAELRNAGIPMRERYTGAILHWKMMLFAGQGVVEFSGANYSGDAWAPAGDPYTNYTDESIFFTGSAPLVNSFRTKFDDLWMTTATYRNYANVPATRTRTYDTFPIDPQLNFVPAESYASRAVGRYNKETRKIDVIMYRITDQRHTNAIIAARQRGIAVRLITEPQQYRDVTRLWHSWNVDRLYMAGVQIRHRVHAGLNHQKSVLLYDLGTTIFGSSNWSSASGDSQEEHNLFTTDAAIFQWFVDQFERKWNNTAGVAENGPFQPLPPDAPKTPSPANFATSVPSASAITLKWYGGPWAHTYDLYLGTDPGNLPLIATEVPLGPSESAAEMQQYKLPAALTPGTRYYWKIVGRTAARLTSTSATWSFTTDGTAPDPATATVVRQPYLQHVTSSQATIVWSTREPGTAEARFRKSGGSLSTSAATTTRFAASATGLAEDYYQHVASLSGLTPSTTYEYDLIVSGIDVNPQTDTLKTAPARGTGSVTFVAFGDSGTGSSEQRQVASLLDAESFDFALHSGDLAYGSADGLGGGTHRTLDDWFFSIYRGWLRARPVFPSIGNHDSRAANDNGRPYLDMFVLPGTGASAAFPDHAERYYSFDQGPVHVVVLDTELAFQGPDTARREAQLAWLDADLAATTQPWKIAVFHRSPYSSGGEHGSDLEVRAAFAPVFERHGVQVAISGHEHDYERTIPLRAGVADAAGVTYLVTGGGGGPLYPSGTSTWTAASASRHHYLRGTVTDCTLVVDAVGLDGAAFDTVSLRRCDVPEDTQPPAAAITAPSAGVTLRGNVTVTVAASDNVGVKSVRLLVDGAAAGEDTQAPFTFLWDSTVLPNGGRRLEARAVDAAGNEATSAPISIVVNNPQSGAGDIVLFAADSTVVSGRWVREADATAAGGASMRNPDRGAAKITSALADPQDYFELTFTPQAEVPYHLWIRGKADGNVYSNDSVFVQFSGTAHAIGTTAAVEMNLEDCSGCRLSGWGWQDNGWGVGVAGPHITFSSDGQQRIRIQPREDGLAIDQIILSPATFLTASPGALKNDATIYPRAAGEPPTPDTTAPSASISSPAAGATVSGIVTVAVNASDDVGVARVELLVDDAVAATDTAAPFGIPWDTRGAANGAHELRARAFDAAGNIAVSAAVSVTVENVFIPTAEVVLYAADSTVVSGRWVRQQDATAAGGFSMRNPDAGAAKRTSALANPADYFELTFTAQAGVPYHLWVRGKADGNVYSNDSVFLQFSGVPEYGIGTTAAVEMNLEDCSGCRVSEWGWQDNGWGVGVAGPHIVFASSGLQTVRIQPREDGLAIDQIILSPERFLTASPGALENDATIYPRTGGEPPPPDTESPTIAISSPAAGATVSGAVRVAVSAADNVGVARVELMVNGTVAGSSTTAPFEIVWDTTKTPSGSYELRGRAFDAAGNSALSDAVGVTVDNSAAPVADIVLYAADATVVSGAWRRQSSTSAAAGTLLRHPNAGAAKRTAALAEPVDYFEVTFEAEANVPYHLWVRGRADDDRWNNDSVFVQFSGTSGSAIGTTSALEMNLEECSGCGVSAWGWQDNGYEGLGPDVVFTTAGPQTIRIQTREDGLSIDQIVLSPSRYRTSAPGPLKNDATVLTR